MRADVSWRGPAQRYAALYRAIAEACRMSGAAAALGVVVSARGLEAALDLPNAERASLCLFTTATARFSASS